MLTVNDDVYDDDEQDKRNRGGATGGVGFLGTLTIVFIVLKLVGVINWKWAWVLAPTWIPLALVCILLIILGAIKCANNKEEI